MTQFNPQNKDSLTYGECLEPAMKITEQADADQYLEAYIEWQSKRMKGAIGNHTAEEICKRNLGYFSGYYSEETRERVERLFKCSHPIFGNVVKSPQP